MNNERSSADHTTRNRILRYGAPAVAAVAAASVLIAPHIGNANGETTGKLPTVEACAAPTAAALGANACSTAVTIAHEVVENKAPADMQITGSTRGFSTTFGNRTYTMTQNLAGLADPTATKNYSVTFGLKGSKADLNDIIEVKAKDVDHLAFIDRIEQGDKDVYVAGFHDPDAPDVPLVAMPGAAGADAAKAALGGFELPPQ